MACRFCAAPDPAALWELLCSREDVLREVPSDRWNVEALHGPEFQAPGGSVARAGYFLDQVDAFDPLFFGISPREAQVIDPQQRLSLELAWEALERAGIPAQRLRGSRTGVFMSAKWRDYADLTRGALDAITPQSATGQALNMIAHRISYAFDLRGPSMMVDADGASALVALHLACQSIRGGDAELALVGGVNLMLSPASMVAMSRFGGLAPDGRCKTFDARANGYGRGEGGGIVVIKSLAAARADGDPIYGIIRGTAVNNDGASERLTAPSQQAQEDVLRMAYARAGMDPGDVQYVEAHGTGTALGDPTEAQALGRVLGRGRPADAPLIIGSVKTNIGHLEGAAGIAGLIKAALALVHRQIPPNLHFVTPNPAIDFDALRLRVATTCEPWPTHQGPALAGVSAFGWGGTNAHVVLEAPARREAAHTQAPRASRGAPRFEPPVGDAPATPEVEPPHLLLLSARTAPALTALARETASWVASRGELSLQDLCYTASLRRGHLEHRLAAWGRSREELAEALTSVARGEPHPGTVSGRRLGGSERGPVFVFPGQGSQWLGMGRQLLRTEPAFRAQLEACDAAIRQEAGWSVLEEMRADAQRSRLASVDVVQPMLFSMSVALAALWRAWGVQPAAVLGHSMGEVAAAHVAGALSLEDAVRISCRRSQVARRMSGRGGMAVVDLPHERAVEALRGYEALVSIAASNSPRSTVLSGDTAALDAILAALERQSIFCRRVQVDYASHSPQMDGLQPELLAVLAQVAPRQGSIPLYSTVTAGPIDGHALTAGYWAANLRQPVRFAQALAALLQAGETFFVEISPHPILGSSMHEIVQHAGRQALVTCSLRRDQDEQGSLLASLAALQVNGCAIDWRARYPQGGRCIPLPSYPWQRQRCWYDVNVAASAAQAPRPEPTPEDERTWGERLRRMAADIARISSEQISLDTPLRELGFDSTMLTELRLRTESVVRRAIPATALWSNPTIAAFAAYLTGAQGVAAPRATPDKHTPEDSELDGLSEEQASLMLAQLVRELEKQDG